MGTFRRIVTGHSANGKSVIASDTRVGATAAVPGFGGIERGTLWGSDEACVDPDDGREPAHQLLSHVDDADPGMHRWHDPFAEPCRVLGALVGARATK